MPITLDQTRPRQLVIHWDEAGNIIAANLMVDVLDSNGQVQKQDTLQLDGNSFSAIGTSAQRNAISAIASLIEGQLKASKGI